MISSRGFTQQGAHTRLVQPNRAEDDIGQNNSLDSAAISEHPWSWLSSWDFTPQGSALEWLYRSKEHPEWEGTHNRHWNPTPGLAQDIPKIPPQAMSSSLFSLPKSDEDFMLLWDIHSGLYISQHHQQHKQDIQVKKTKSMMFVQNYFCAHTNSPHSSLGPTQRTEIKWQRHRYGRLQGGIIPFHCIEMLLALPSHPALLDPVNPSTGKCRTAGKCDALK